MIASFTRSLSKEQRKWPTIDRELFAIITACRKYHNYLVTGHFQVYTDHRPLLALTKPKGIKGYRFDGWAIEINRYRFTVYYIPGPQNHLPDALSRIKYNFENQGQCIDKLTSEELADKCTKHPEVCIVEADASEEEPESGTQELSQVSSQELREHLLSSQDTRNAVKDDVIKSLQETDPYCRRITAILGGQDKIHSKIRRRFVEDY